MKKKIGNTFLMKNFQKYVYVKDQINLKTTNKDWDCGLSAYFIL